MGHGGGTDRTTGSGRMRWPSTVYVNVWYTILAYAVLPTTTAFHVQPSHLVPKLTARATRMGIAWERKGDVSRKVLWMKMNGGGEEEESAVVGDWR